MITDAARRLWALTDYTPHSKGAWEYHDSEARFKLAACGRRYGKSYMAEKDWLPDLFDEDNPGRFWMVALSYDTCDEFQYLWDDVVFKLGLKGAPGLKMANNVRTGEMFIEFPWKTRVDVKSIKQPQTLVGKGLRRVLLSEAAKMPPAIWHKYLSPALADHRGKADFPSTPEGFNWYYKEHLKGLEGDPDYASWNFASWDNPVVYPGGFEDPEVQRQLPRDANGNPIDDPWFWQEIGAEFRTMAGIIYPEFNRKVHVRPTPYLPGVDNYMGCDWGFSHPLAALDVQVTPSGEVRVWREYVEAGQPVHVHAKTLLDRDNPEGYKLRCAYGDSADADAVETFGRIFTRTIAKAEAKDVRAGIRLVKSFLRSVDGPRLFIDPSCKQLIREFESYRMKTPRGIISNEEAEQGDEPLKKGDDALDALRYLLMHLFKLGGLSSIEDYTGSPSEDEGGIFTRSERDRMTLDENFSMGKVL